MLFLLTTARWQWQAFNIMNGVWNSNMTWTKNVVICLRLLLSRFLDQYLSRSAKMLNKKKQHEAPFKEFGLATLCSLGEPARVDAEASIVFSGRFRFYRFLPLPIPTTSISIVTRRNFCEAVIAVKSFSWFSLGWKPNKGVWSFVG